MENNKNVSIELLYKENHKKAYSIAINKIKLSNSKIVGRVSELAEDILQSCYLRIIESLEQQPNLYNTQEDLTCEFFRILSGTTKKEVSPQKKMFETIHMSKLEKNKRRQIQKIRNGDVRTKKCKKCRIPKLLNEFLINKSNSDKLSHICKECSSLYHKEYNSKNVEKKKYKKLINILKHSDGIKAIRNIVGVYFDSGCSKKPYRATIQHNHIVYNLGNFSDYKKAELARNERLLIFKDEKQFHTFL